MAKLRRSRWRERLLFTAGFGLAALGLGTAAEAFLRTYPPKELHPYLGDESPVSGPFRPDPLYGVAYRSWQAFGEENLGQLLAFGPLAPNSGDPRPIWAFFGNSFVQGPGGIADMAIEYMPSRRVFALRRNEYLFVRHAQIELLLEHGLKPERIFFVLLPLDTATLGWQPLDTVTASAKGGLIHRPRLPAGLAGELVGDSRLAFTAWVRADRQKGNPKFHPRTLPQGLNAGMRADLDRLLGRLGEVTRAHGVPTTLALIPNFEQIMGRAPFGFQDELTAIARSHGLDVYDARDLYRDESDKLGLFLPDKHLSDRGNRLLIADLLRHVERIQPSPAIAGNGT